VNGLVVMPIAAMTVVACGGSSSSASDNGEGTKSASQTINDAVSCLRSTQSVHMKADLTQSGQHRVFDVDTGSGASIAGSFSLGGLTFQLVTIAGRSYFNADQGFWAQFGGAAAASRYSGTWVAIPPGTAADQLTSGVTLITNYKSYADGLARSTSSSFTKNSNATTPDGRQAVSLTAADGSLYVSKSGSACPIYLTIASTGTTGYIAFSHFNSTGSITPPPNAIELITPPATTPTP
jgi:hypothetical protein